LYDKVGGLRVPVIAPRAGYGGYWACWFKLAA
jgi:hypothetical protein